LEAVCGWRRDELTMQAPSSIWQDVVKTLKVIRTIKRWWLRVQAAAVVRWTLQHAPIFFQVRAGFRRRTEASRGIQRGWRRFSARVDNLVRALFQGPWRRYERCYLEGLFTACPLEEEVVVGDNSLLTGESLASSAPTTSDQFARGSSSSERGSHSPSPWKYNGVSESERRRIAPSRRPSSGAQAET